MPVLYNNAGRATHLHALPNKNVFNNVLYLGTVEKHHAPPQNGVPDDDVVYFNTVNKGHALKKTVRVNNTTVPNTAGKRPTNQIRTSTSSNQGPSRVKRPSYESATSTPHPP